MTTMTTTIEQTATERVNQSEALKPFSNLFLTYDWSNRDEHLNWVATATEDELILWAEQIRRDEDGASA